MTALAIHTLQTAPKASQPFLAGTKEAFGFIPNLSAIFANSPAMIEAYGVLAGHFEKTAFTPTERQIILMTNNRLNGCTYCMAAHTTVSQMQNIPSDIIAALRDGTKIADPKLQALQTFTAQVHQSRGAVAERDVDAFLAAGYAPTHILDVILGTGLKVLTNYTNHITKTPLDTAFQHNKWDAPVGAPDAIESARALGEASTHWP